MTMLRFLLFMVIAAASLERLGFADQSSTVSQQAPWQRSDKAAEQRTNEARNGTDQARPRKVDQNPKWARQTKSRPSVRTSKASRRQVRPDKGPVTNNLRAHATGSTTGLQQKSSKSATTTDHRTPPGPSPIVSVNGQHFRNFRDPGARLAASGGPFTATRGTGAINGTNMRRKF